MKQLILPIAVCAALAATPAMAGQAATAAPGDTQLAAATTTLSKADQTFIHQAAIAGMAEVAEAQLAVSKAQRDEVKQFAQRMIDDHTKANDELKQLLAGKQVTVPTTLDAKHKQEQARLEKLSGAAFDRAYIENQVKAHQQAVALFKNESETGKDPELKQFAAKVLPTLQEHHDAVVALAKNQTS
jgi:putative membrane protein